MKHSILLDGVKVGSGARLKNCIVDKHVDIPPHEEIGYNTARDRERFTVSPTGIVVVPRQFDFSGVAADYNEADETAMLGETVPQRSRVTPTT